MRRPTRRIKMLYLDAAPNAAHRKLAELEAAGKLTAVVTQNIDGLHQKAGSRNVLELHGSVLRNYCTDCRKFYEASYIKDTEGIPRCTCGGIIKPDVVLYEEELNAEVLDQALACIMLIAAWKTIPYWMMFMLAGMQSIPDNIYEAAQIDGSIGLHQVLHITIPLMKKVGYSPAFAGAVEAVASTGGQIMPPVMGAAAFIMADITGLGYLPIATAALLPAVLYYWALLSMIHLEAVRKNLGYLPPEMVPDARVVIRKLYYLLPIVILIGALWVGRSVISSAFFATASIFVISQFSKETRLTFKGVLDALALSSKNAMMISSCCAAAGIIVGVITLTGVGCKFISVITDLAGNNLFLLMLFLAVTCIVLGMGVPTAPAYVIVATLGAPALMKAGVPMISAHLFVFYFAILSVITPPVCVTAFAGAAIAEAHPMRTGFVSCKLGLVAFIIPFMFVYQPALLLIGTTTEVTIACITSIVGVVGLASGLQGYLITDAKIWERPLLFFGGLMMIYPGTSSDIIGLALILAVTVLQLIRRRSSGRAAAA